MAARVIPFAFHCGRFTGRFPLVITRCHYSTLGVPSGNSPGVHPTPGNHSHGNSRGGGDSDGFKCWQIHSYGGPNELQLSTSSRQPKISSPSEVLVKVKAASVNPIDLAMTKGYGAETINILRDLTPLQTSSLLELPNKLVNYLKDPFNPAKSVIEFPLTLGRDFSGVVVSVGHGVKGLSVNDEVYGVVDIQRQGSHADYVVVSDHSLSRKPRTLTFPEAAALPYVALTNWSAVHLTGSYCNLAQKKFLVLGGSGGLGTYSIQYLKSQGATAIATCSTDAVSLLESLGADVVIDYKSDSANQQIKQEGPYDCILHMSGPESLEQSTHLMKYLKPVTGQLVTLSPPFLSNVDKHGILKGTVQNIADLVTSNAQSIANSKSLLKWAFFVPHGGHLEKVSELVDSKRITPVIHKVFKFEDLPDAYKLLEEGHLRGKVVVEM